MWEWSVTMTMTRKSSSDVDDCYAKAKAIIMEHRDVLEKCAQLLLEKEKISRDEFEALFYE